MERAFFALQVSPFQTGSSGWATTIVPSPMPLEKEGTFTNIEGRVQRLRAAVPPPPGVLDGIVLAAELGRRLGLDLPDQPPAAFADMAGSRAAFAGLTWAGIGERGVRPEPAPGSGTAPAAPHVAEGEPEGTIVVGYRQLMSGPTVEGAPALHFQRRSGIEISHDDAQEIGVATGDRVEVSFGGTAVIGRGTGAAAAATGRRAAGDGGAVRRAGRAAGRARGVGRCLTGSSSPPSSRSCWSTW